MARIKVTASTKYVGSEASLTFTIDDEDLDDMSDADRTKLIEEYAFEELWNLVDWSWQEVDG